MNAEQLEDFFFGTFGSCGCGDPDAVAQLLFDVLARVKSGSWRDGLTDLLPTDGTMFSYLGWLSHIKLLDHGTAMPGWVTPLGDEVLAALAKYGLAVDKWQEVIE